MNEMVKKESNLPASVTAMQGLANSVMAVGAGGGGEQYMKMTKFGEFVFGAENLEVEEESTWAINPTQFTHGWICWGTKEHGTDGEMLGEIMASANGPIPEEASLPEARGKWTKQVGILLRCLDGEDEGIQAVFKTNSKGGTKAYTALVSAVLAEFNAKSEYVVPVVKLVAAHYDHKTYGKIFTPKFEIVDWMSMDGLKEAVGVAEDEAEDESEPEKRTRAKREPAKVEKEEVEEKPVRRRRKRA